jgi:hypothetical protein
MNVTTKNSRPAPVLGRVAERTARAPRFVCSATSRAVLPAAMGNRAFIRAWAVRRTGLAARILK